MPFPIVHNEAIERALERFYGGQSLPYRMKAMEAAYPTLYSLVEQIVGVCGNAAYAFPLMVFEAMKCARPEIPPAQSGNWLYLEEQFANELFEEIFYPEQVVRECGVERAMANLVFDLYFARCSRVNALLCHNLVLLTRRGDQSVFARATGRRAALVVHEGVGRMWERTCAPKPELL
jgi:hypothetical protein